MSSYGVIHRGIAETSPYADQSEMQAYGNQAIRKPKQTPNETCADGNKNRR